jgi:hypothetical protein
MADEGFLGRWSRRKQAVRQGQAIEAEPPAAPPQVAAQPAAAAPAPVPPPVVAEVPAAPTLEEAEALTPQSDFSRFAARDVAPEVKNAAMKKLFSDPHFNVMDGLDIYIDDYSRPDPIPPEMLRQLASARFLGLFDDEDKAQAGPGGPGGMPGEMPEQKVAQCDLCNDLPSQLPSQEVPVASPDDADPDLRLQQDDAPGGKAPGHGAS